MMLSPRYSYPSRREALTCGYSCRTRHVLVHPPGARGTSCTIECQANTGASSPDPAAAAAAAAPRLAVSIEEVEAQISARHRVPQLPTWVSDKKAGAKKTKKATAGSTPLRVGNKLRLAAETKASDFGLSPEQFKSKVMELRLLMPGVTESTLLSLEDDILKELVADTALVATRLVQASTRMASNALPSTAKFYQLPQLFYQQPQLFTGSLRELGQGSAHAVHSARWKKCTWWAWDLAGVGWGRATAT